jgi:hypothetical protein
MLSWTNSYTHTRYQFTENFSLNAGFDNRRNIRLYRDHITPETEFDDAYRQGYWTGFAQRFNRYLRCGADARRTTGGSFEDSDSYTGHVSVYTRVQFSLRSSYFDRSTLQGWMHSGRVGTQFGSRLHLELGGGTRDEASVDHPGDTYMLTWTSLAIDYSLNRQIYLSLSGEHSNGEVDRTDQVFATTSYRF